MVKNAFHPPETCPVCGESVPRGALSCPGCGTDERAGWDDEAAVYDDLDLPDEAYDDEPKPVPRRPAAPRSRLWIGALAVLLVLLILSLVLR